MLALLWILMILLFIYVMVCVFYYFIQERLIFVRFPLKKSYRFKFLFPFEEKTITAQDGAQLHALYFPTTNVTPLGTVLYFHGNSGSLRRWGKQAPRFTQLGYDVWMPDYRGYGKSEGRITENALHQDALLWYEKVKEEVGEESIIIYGRSLGSGFAVPLAARSDPARLILETPFANLYEVAKHYSMLIPYRLLLKYRFRNDIHIPAVRCPVYIFHGKRDRVVPYASALRLYSLVNEEVHRRMFTFAKGRHSNLARYKRFNTQMADCLMGEGE